MCTLGLEYAVAQLLNMGAPSVFRIKFQILAFLLLSQLKHLTLHSIYDTKLTTTMSHIFSGTKWYLLLVCVHVCSSSSKFLTRPRKPL